MAKEKGYFTMVHTVQSAKGIEQLQRNWAFAGFIVVGASNRDFFKIDDAILTPVSYIDTYFEKAKKLDGKLRNFIGTDEEKISESIANYLSKMGHKKFFSLVLTLIKRNQVSLKNDTVHFVNFLKEKSYS